MQQITVKAKDGVKVPYEGKANRYIESEAVKVDKTAYIRARLRDGDLIEIKRNKMKGDK